MKFLFLWIALTSAPVSAAEFREASEKDYPLRSIARLQVTNAKGGITIQGWALDKIRIKIRKLAIADDAEQAKKVFEGFDYRYQVTDDNIEISNQYGSQLNIEERLQKKGDPGNRVDMVIYAPPKLKLMVWSVDGKVVLKGWNSKAELRSNSGLLQVEGFKGDSVSILCSSCSANLKNIRAMVRCVSKSGVFNLNHVDGKNTYVETDSGLIRLSHIQGDQLYISQSGAISGEFLSGKVEYHSKQGSVDLQEVSGFLSGETESGNFVGTIKDWAPKNEALLESAQGNIQLAMPRHISSLVDIWSIQGRTNLEFALEKTQDPTAFGPEPANHLIGRVREGGDLLKVFSESGDISISKR